MRTSALALPQMCTKNSTPHLVPNGITSSCSGKCHLLSTLRSCGIIRQAMDCMIIHQWRCAYIIHQDDFLFFYKNDCTLHTDFTLTRDTYGPLAVKVLCSGSKTMLWALSKRLLSMRSVHYDYATQHYLSTVLSR